MTLYHRCCIFFHLATLRPMKTFTTFHFFDGPTLNGFSIVGHRRSLRVVYYYVALCPGPCWLAWSVFAVEICWGQ